MQAVLFDLWETLVHDLPERSRARQLWRAANVQEIFQTAGLEADLDLIDLALTTVLSRTLNEMQNDGRDVDARGRIVLFAEELAGLGGPRPGEELYEALEAGICAITPGLYPAAAADGAAVLAALKAEGLKTALVSNAGVTTAPTLRRMLADYGMARYLDAMVFSDELQLAKPAAAMFTTALEAIDCPAAEATFVGDSPHNDIAGAQAVGMKAVLIGNRRQDGIKPDATISVLTELQPILSRYASA